MSNTAPKNDNQNARFDFNKAAARIVKDHPELKANTIFIDLGTQKRQGPMLARIKGSFSKDFREGIAKAMARAAKLKGGAGYALRNKGGLNAVLLTLDRSFGFVGNAKDVEMDGQYAFHHEIAHLVVPAVHPRKIVEYFEKLFDRPYSREEGAADAYAVIRHLQQYGVDSKAITRAPIRRAMDVIHHTTPEYLTTFIIDKIFEDKAKFAALTPAQVVEAVGGYAARYTPSRADTERLLKEFEPLKGELYKASKDNTAPFRKLAQITLDPASSPLTFYLGNRVLGAFMGKILNGPEWVDIAKKLHEREAGMTLDKLFPPPTPAEPAKSLKRA